MITFQWVGLNKWIDGAARFGDAALDAVEKSWGEVTDRAYDRTQQDVHVITGNLKASGKKIEAIRSRDGVEMGLHYDIEYAVYEWARGGEHDFMSAVEVEFEEQYASALLDALSEAANSWN